MAYFKEQYREGKVPWTVDGATSASKTKKITVKSSFSAAFKAASDHV